MYEFPEFVIDYVQCMNGDVVWCCGEEPNGDSSSHFIYSRYSKKSSILSVIVDLGHLSFQSDPTSASASASAAAASASAALASSSSSSTSSLWRFSFLQPLRNFFLVGEHLCGCWSQPFVVFRWRRFRFSSCFAPGLWQCLDNFLLFLLVNFFAFAFAFAFALGNGNKRVWRHRISLRPRGIHIESAKSLGWYNFLPVKMAFPLDSSCALVRARRHHFSILTGLLDEAPRSFF